MGDVAATPHALNTARELVAPPAAAQTIAEEVGALPYAAFLVESGELAAFVAEAESIPHVVYEIGRLRELTFRAVGEGTGKALDLDSFDGHYLHLVLWNRERAEVVGAYRCGATDRILPRFGADGLYTSTLFSYRTELLARLTPALELGRAFVRAEYQRTYSPLLLLWKAIGRFIVRNPGYHRLFGSVSLSGDVPPRAQRWILRHLLESAYLPGLARFVRARHPVGEERLIDRSAGPRFADMADLERAIGALGGASVGVPVLLKQYLKLGGLTFAFGRDPGFGDTLDILTLVDLARTPRTMLERYLGKGVGGFLDYHGFREPASRLLGAAA
jgi:hypothetical protein